MPATADELTDYDHSSRREFVDENADEFFRLAQEGHEEIGRGTVSFHLDIDEQVIDQSLELGEEARRGELGSSLSTICSAL